jgi:redox-sensitive bicupin YhaK (pirin superfamily)
MQAGRGILHSEMPLHEKDGPDPVGMQLWVNLPKSKKMDPPDYQEYTSTEMPYAHPSEE